MNNSIALCLFLFCQCLFAKDIIVLIPGAFSTGNEIYLSELSPLFNVVGQEKYFQHFQKKLEQKGHRTFVCPKVKHKDKWSIEKRAVECQKNILSHLELYPKDRFHLLGHSTGGLVARKILESIPTAIFVKSVTTIATPHYGSHIADFLHDEYINGKTLSHFIEFAGLTAVKKNYLPELRTEKYRLPYGENLLNPLSVPIYSISNYKGNIYHTLLGATGALIPELNDGVIESSSMIYGIHLGDIKADHMESVCILYTKYSRGCKLALKLIFNHFENLGVN